jgi:hypothetical protein
VPHLKCRERYFFERRGGARLLRYAAGQTWDVSHKPFPFAETLRIKRQPIKQSDVGKLQQLIDLYQMKIFVFAMVASLALSAQVHAQSSEPGPIDTPAGALQFVRDDRDFVATLDRGIFDRFDAKTLQHFDEPAGANGKLTRTLVQTEAGPLVYDLRRSPPLVQRTGKRMTVQRVFWQGDEVVMHGSLGWYRFKGGVLTRLQSSTSVYH